MPTRRGFIGGSAAISAALIAGAAPRSAWGQTIADVAIIGAGLAGLNAARMLEAAGLKVAVLEGETRIGGRLRTLDTMPGSPEAGGIQVGAGYARLHHIASELGVGLSQADGRGAGRRQVPGNLYRIGETSVPSADWPNSPANHLSADERQTEPAALLRKYAAALPHFDSPEAWLEAPPAQDRSLANTLSSAGASAEALRLMEANFNGNSLAGMSAISLARSFAIYRAGAGPISTISGGSQRLPEAMAGALAAPVQTGVRVYGISEDADGVTLLSSAGEMKIRHAICTVPFAALRRMTLEAPLPPFMAHMIAGLPYTRASFAYLSARTPFWREDGLPDTIWSDHPVLGRVFVLSDGNGDGRGGSGPPMLKVWTTGAGADLLDRMPQAEASNCIIAEIEAARPSAKGQLHIERFFSWQKEPGACGIYHHIGTGQAAMLAAATRHVGNRLHFAGEHLAQASSGMEAALESGERAAGTVLAKQA